MRNVIVTGGSRGLGLATAKTLAAAGFRVIAVARSMSPDLAAVAPDSLGAAGSGAAGSGAAGTNSIVFRAFDLSELSGIGAFVRGLRAEFGPLYGLVNNAASGAGGVLGNMRDQSIEQMVRLNTVAPIILTKYVVRSMMNERDGRIVNIASVVAATGYSGLSVYGATKASLVGFTRSLAREVGQLGITVNAIAPGFIATDMTQDLDAAQRETIARRSALRRLAEPADVAGSVAYLLSEAGRNITGTVITVDAGNTA